MSILKIPTGMSVHQKLGIILESKVVQKLNLEKKCFYPKIGLLKFKLIFLTSKIDFESTILAVFD